MFIVGVGNHKCELQSPLLFILSHAILMQNKLIGASFVAVETLGAQFTERHFISRQTSWFACLFALTL